MYNWLEWVAVSIGDYPLSMVDFVDWLGSKAWILFFVCPLPWTFVWLASLYTTCILLCHLIQLIFTYQEKKEEV